MGKLTAAIIVIVVAGVAAPVAFAQSSAPPTSQWFIGAGGGIMNPLHGDDYDEGPVAFVTFGFTDNRRVRIDGEITRRSHLDRYVEENRFLYGGPTGVHGNAVRIDSGRETADWTAGVNLFGRTAWRTVSLFAGPGVVLHRKELRQYRTVTGCTPPVPSSGFECTSFDNRSAEHGFGLQLMAGVDLALHRTVTAWVAGRGEYRRGLAMGGVGVAAGLRIAIR